MFFFSSNSVFPRPCSDTLSHNYSYRVGIPGFLISEEMKKLGYKANNGLDDQRLALRWIKSHIGGFGGDAERVTFLGQSAGSGKTPSAPDVNHSRSAALTWTVAGNIHLELDEPLFQQYISMAGTAFSRPRRPDAVQKAYAALTKELGLADASPEEQIQRLLKEVDTGSLGAWSRKYNLGPTLDGDLVPEALVFRNQVEPEAALKTFPGLRYCKKILVGDCQFDVSTLS
jgi:carboxylesterase type B